MNPRQLLRSAIAGISALAFPPACLVCDADLRAAGRHFCIECRAGLAREPTATCPRCASAVGPHANLKGGCSRCRGATFRFASAVALGPYDGVLRDAVLLTKRGGAEVLAGRLGELLACERRDELLAGDPQLVVPVALHWRRRWARGYNQADELALGVARVLGLPCRRDLLRRTSHTQIQSQLTGPERRANLAGRFRARPGVAGLRVLVVDDVLTTGATCDAAAGALLDAGAAQVRVGVLAHSVS